MIYRGHGGNEVIMKHGSHVVHRITSKKTAFTLPAAAAPSDTGINNDNDETLSKSLRWRAILRRAKAMSTRILSLTIGILFIVQCTRDCRAMFQRQAQVSQAVPPKPLMVHAPTITNVTHLKVETYPPQLIQDRRNRYWINNGANSYYKPPPIIPEGCVAEEWVHDLHPSCLQFHQLDMTDFFFNEQRKSVVIHGKKRRKKFRFIGEGGFRAAFMITEYDGTRRVLKTLIYDDDRDFNPLNFERMRRDAVISEQLTASPYIADIYGYCAQSALVDYSNNRDLDYIFEQKTKPTKDELFQIAHDVAQSIADAHHFNDEGRATIVHMDIKPDQWILLDGRYKLNDFNLARFLTWDPEKQQNCNVASGYGFRYQAPEQFIGETPLTEKIDVFSLGNVLGALLTGDFPFPELSDDSAEDAVTEGEIWKITDPDILNSTHPFDINVQKAMEMCLVFEPEKRPHAQEVADFWNALSKYKESKDYDSLR